MNQPANTLAPVDPSAYREVLGHYPTGVTVVPELPRNATGKVTRAALREPYWAGRDRRVS